MSRARLRKAPRRLYLHWAHLASPKRTTHPRVAPQGCPSPFKSNSLHPRRQSTRNKRSHYSPSPNPAHPLTRTVRPTSDSYPPWLLLLADRVLSLSPTRRGDRRKAHSPGVQGTRRKVRTLLLLHLQRRVPVARAVPTWARTSGHVSGRTIMSVISIVNSLH